MDQTTRIINQVLPILILILLGFWIRSKQFLSETTISELRKVVVNIALPAVLFVSFLNIDLKGAYFVIFLVLFVLCVLLFLLGRLIQKRFVIQYTYFPYLVTGFEYGMLAVSLFGAAYGLDKIGYIAVVDLGHEIFIWFAFLPLLLMVRDGAQKPGEIVSSFISSPVVIAIIASLALNVAGLAGSLYTWPLTGGLMSALNFLSSLTVPLILIIVGYGVKFDRAGIGQALGVVALRLGLMLPLIWLLNTFLVQRWLHLDPFFKIAVFTLLVMPPPFIVPLFARADLPSGEKRYINNVLAVHTVISVAIFLVYFILNPAGSQV